MIQVWQSKQKKNYFLAQVFLHVYSSSSLIQSSYIPIFEHTVRRSVRTFNLELLELYAMNSRDAFFWSDHQTLLF